MQKSAFFWFVIAAAFVAHAQSTAPEASGTVSVKRATLFERPSTDTPSQAYLVRGDRAEILGYEHRFFWIRFTNPHQVSTNGYLRCQELKPHIQEHAIVTASRAALNQEELADDKRPYVVHGDRLDVILGQATLNPDRVLVRHTAGRHVTLGWIDHARVQFVNP